MEYKSEAGSGKAGRLGPGRPHADFSETDWKRIVTSHLESS